MNKSLDTVAALRNRNTHSLAEELNKSTIFVAFCFLDDLTRLLHRLYLADLIGDYLSEFLA
jgi:hypothetical protein